MRVKTSAPAASWGFLIVLLYTVGRPLRRYLLPVIPIMFWTLGMLVALAWGWLTVALEKLLVRRLAP